MVGFLRNQDLFLSYAISVVFHGGCRRDSAVTGRRGSKNRFWARSVVIRLYINECIYAGVSVCGMQCVPDRLQIGSFVNVRPVLIGTDAF